MDGTPPPSEYADIMKCFDTKAQIPVTYTLATQFAVCDHWFSSMPGPTWPNRFFVHGASSSGLDHSPGKDQMAAWYGGGFAYRNGSIFDAMTKRAYRFRLYVDREGTLSGSIPQVASIKNISLVDDIHDSDNLASELRYPFGPRYVFIEPNYGDLVDESYSGGSSQHPVDGMYRGEQLIKYVYEAIRNSPAWYTSLLVVTYDEHGGFYDSVNPGPATAPGDVVCRAGIGYNEYGFQFNQYGTRVPAVVVSPWIAEGTVDKTLYDHASVPATLESLLGLDPLTNRDKGAATLTGLVSGSSAPRTNCPTTLVLGPPDASAAEPTPARRAAMDQEPLPESGNVWGFLHVALKAEIALSSGGTAEIEAIKMRFDRIKTRGEARAYLERVRKLADAAQKERV